MQDAAATTVSMTLADGETHVFRKIGLDMWCEFSDWINSRMKRAPGTPVGLEEMMEHVQTFQGMRWLLWRSIKTEVPIDQMGTLIGSDLKNINALLESIVDLPTGEGSAEGNATETAALTG